MWPQPSGLKNKPSTKPASKKVALLLSFCLLATCFQARFLLGLFFDPEGDVFLRNVD
jgi:hypothetical protein